MHQDAFSELAVIIAFGTGIALIMRLLRQPLIIGHILTGILAGPTVFKLVESSETLEVFASIGIAMLLFLVGLGLNPRVIREVGKVAFLTGIGQVVFTSSLGFVLLKAMGFDNTPSLYLSIALAFSSTIIVLKILNDKKEQSRLHGKIAIGFLLVQDIVATFALLFVTASGKGGLESSDLANLLGKGCLIISGLILVGHYVLPWLKNIISGSQEFLFLFSIAWGLGIGALFKFAGFSLEVGALVAGVTLASFPFAGEAASRLKPLRDFFIFLFFVVLGARLDLTNILEVLPQAALLSLFVLVGNPLIVISIMGIMGYTKKTSFKTSLAVAQISEFSLVLLLLAHDSGSVDDHVLSLGTMVALITIALSAYMMLYDEKLFSFIERFLSPFERRKVRREIKAEHAYELVLFGYKKGGQEFIKVFKQLKKRFLVIDYNPEVIDLLEGTKDLEFMYGDATDFDLLDEAGLEHSKLAVSTITDLATNKFLLDWLEQKDGNCVFICQADTIEQAVELYSLGAAYVMLPHYIGSEKMSAFIKKSGLKKSEFRKFRDHHLAYLQTHYSQMAKEDSAV